MYLEALFPRKKSLYLVWMAEPMLIRVTASHFCGPEMKLSKSTNVGGTTCLYVQNVHWINRFSVYLRFPSCVNIQLISRPSRSGISNRDARTVSFWAQLGEQSILPTAFVKRKAFFTWQTVFYQFLSWKRSFSSHVRFGTQGFLPILGLKHTVVFRWQIWHAGFSSDGRFGTQIVLTITYLARNKEISSHGRFAMLSILPIQSKASLTKLGNEKKKSDFEKKCIRGGGGTGKKKKKIGECGKMPYKIFLLRGPGQVSHQSGGLGMTSCICNFLVISLRWNSPLRSTQTKFL